MRFGMLETLSSKDRYLDAVCDLRRFWYGLGFVGACVVVAVSLGDRKWRWGVVEIFGGFAALLCLAVFGRSANYDGILVKV
jgi:hypothetical protein